MSSAKLKFNCAHGKQFFGYPRYSFSTSRTCLGSSIIVSLVFSHPFLLRAEFLRCTVYSTSACRITRRVVCDNDNQRVKWGLIFFRRGGEWREKERERRGWQGGERRRKMRVYTCQETRRLVHNIGGPCADSRRQKGARREAGGRKERRETSERASLDGDTRISRARPHHL